MRKRCQPQQSSSLRSRRPETTRIEQRIAARRAKRTSLIHSLCPCCFTRRTARVTDSDVVSLEHGSSSSSGDASEKLPGRLSSFDRLQFNSLVRLLDGVGEPAGQARTVRPHHVSQKRVGRRVHHHNSGLLVLLIIIWYLYQLCSLTTLINQGAIMQLNPPLPGQTGQQVDVPTLDFNLHTVLTFYEADSPSLQRIRRAGHDGL